MCLILFSYDSHPRFRLILAANRDEFYERPTAPLSFWTDAPKILAGRDLKEQGTWMGVDRSGRFAALTNFRDPASVKPEAPSRGALVGDYLREALPPKAYLESLQPGGDRYNGFNLLVGNRNGLYYYANRMGEVQKLHPGVYGLSNRFLDTPWPKVKQGKRELKRIISQDSIDVEALFHLLEDRNRPPDEELPDTGMGLEWERMLAPRFIAGEVYGTRSASVLLVGRDGEIRFSERTFAPGNGTDGGKITPEKTRTVRFVAEPR